MSQKNNTLSLGVLRLVAVSWFVFLGLVMSQFLFPTNSVNVKQPVIILNENHTIYPGESIKFELEVDKKKHYPATVRKIVYCDNGWAYNEYDVIPESLDIGQYSIKSDYTVIPLESPESTCHLTISVDLEIGPFGRRESKIFKTEDFYIKHK